jgi:hypothetical protein
MKNALILTALIALAAFGVVGCASSSRQHAGKSCDGACCKQGAEACAKCCGTDCAACCKK